MVPSVPALPPPPPSDATDCPIPIVLPEYILVDLEGDFLVGGAETEHELLPMAEQWSSDSDFVQGGLAIYKRHAILEI